MVIWAMMSTRSQLMLKQRERVTAGNIGLKIHRRHACRIQPLQLYDTLIMTFSIKLLVSLLTLCLFTCNPAFATALDNQGIQLPLKAPYELPLSNTHDFVSCHVSFSRFDRSNVFDHRL